MIAIAQRTLPGAPPPHAHTQALDDEKRVLRERFLAAKAAAEGVSAARDATAHLKAAIENHRVQRSVGAMLRAGEIIELDADDNAAGADDAERILEGQLAEARGAYAASFSALRGLKADIEGRQAALESGRLQLQATFEAWYAEAAAAVMGREWRGDGRRQTGDEDVVGTPASIDGGAVQLAPPPLPLVPVAMPLPLPLPLPRTGVAEVDDDIAAFYAARDTLRRRQQAAAAQQQQQQQQQQQVSS